MELKDRGAWCRVLVWINPKDSLLRANNWTNSGYVQMPATIAGHIPGIRKLVDSLLVWKPGDKPVANSMPLGGSPHQSHSIVEKDACVRGYAFGVWTNDEVECEDIPVGTLQWVSAPDGTSIPYVGKASTQPILACKVCKTFNSYAVPNQKDGVSFVCYSCRGR